MSARVWKIVAVLMLAVGLIAMQWFQFDASRHHSSTSFSDGPLGSSIFLNVARQFAPHKVSVLKHAIYSQAELGGRGALLIVSSPLGEFSTREAAIVRSFIEAGGKLLLSCHEEACQESVKRIAAELGTDFVTIENQDYVDSVPERISLEGDDFFSSGQYAFYGARSFYSDGEKYLRRSSVGLGQVFAISSVFPLANGLIGQADNWRLAEALIRQSDAIIIDEYHHFFSERSFADLLMTPWVSLPLLGLLAAALAFFFFGESVLIETAGTSVRVPSFHRFSQDALRGLLEDKKVYAEALKRQNQIVRRAHIGSSYMPEGSQSIGALALKHRDLLRQKRGQLK